MKKIDLHIHTVATISDSDFEFSLEVFKRYVKEANLAGVAVTNHDVFDASQFQLIQQHLEIPVFPGIEINVESGHVLVIDEPSNIADFVTRTNRVSEKITKIGDRISVDELQSIFGDLNNYLVIPHYEKSPPIRGDTLQSLLPYIVAGEVDSAKKFLRTIRDESKLTPVLFSDARMKHGLPTLPTRQTFVDCGAVTLNALKACLRDKRKVALSESDGNQLWQVFEDGQQLSTGLNVLVGERSSGKTHTLDKISETVENAKYIKQFSLVQQNETVYEREFRSGIERKRGAFVDEYLSGLKRVIDVITKIDLVANSRAIDRYVETLLRSAEEADKKDAFSNVALFDEVEYAIGNSKTLRELIESVRQVIENIEFREIIDKHIDSAALKALACELIELYWRKNLEQETKKHVNELVSEIKGGLRIRTAATQVEDVDIYEICMDKRRVDKFAEIVGYLRREEIIYVENIQGFKIEAKKGPYTGAGEVKSASGVRAAFSEAFGNYDDPYHYLQGLLGTEALPQAEHYKLFAKITYRILNEDGYEVSGGERSEFRLLQEIDDAQNYDVLLIDEPESSFDNLFLKSDVNNILKAISETMPVVVVTHNNTVGASVGADYILHTSKELEGGDVVYRIYSGYPTDKQLSSVDGKAHASHEILMNSLEAGSEAYESRRQGYEAIKD